MLGVGRGIGTERVVRDVESEGQRRKEVKRDNEKEKEKEIQRETERQRVRDREID